MIFKVVAFIFAVVSLTSGVTIQCNFRNIDWSSVGYQYSCSVATITDDGNLTHVFAFTGDHLSGKTNADVKGFGIRSSHQDLNRIPKGIEKLFPNLILFEWNFGNLTTLTVDDLAAFPNLQVFDAYDNKLTSLDGDLFKHTPNLIYISFAKNLLRHVGIGLLEGLINLTAVYLRHNSCIDTNAGTPTDIQELKLNLQNLCPPSAITTTSSSTSSTSTSLAPTTKISTSTESGQCSIKCVESIETLEEEVERQSMKIARQDEEIVRYREENARQDEKIATQADEITALGDAIKELEKQMREIWARP